MPVVRQTARPRPGLPGAHATSVWISNLLLPMRPMAYLSVTGACPASLGMAIAAVNGETAVSDAAAAAMLAV